MQLSQLEICFLMHMYYACHTYDSHDINQYLAADEALSNCHTAVIANMIDKFLNIIDGSPIISV